MTEPEPTTDDRDTPTGADRAMAEFCQRGEPAALGQLFDLAAPVLQRVARHLASDAHTADDLVQVTFLVAIERADSFRPGAKVLPWLTGILRNQALLAHRRQRRQPDLDRLAPEADTDPATAAERNEIAARIEAALAELSEAYRPVLVLALQHGLGAHEIAAALGRPEGSVRTQLMRGLEKLRALLPVSLAGVMAGLLPNAGWAAMRATVLATAARKGTILAAGIAPSLLLSGIAMTKKLLAAAAVALVASAVWFALSDSPSTPPTASESTPTQSVAESADSPAAGAPRREVPATPAPGALHVRLVHAQTRAPLSGVRVEARGGRRPLTAATLGGGPAVATTDAAGTCTLQFQAAAQIERFLIARSAHNVGTEVRRSVRVEPSNTIDLELEAGAGVRVSGVVVDEQGAPAPRARVFAWDGSDDGVARTADGFNRRPDVQGVADAQGRFDLEAVADQFVLSADHGSLWCPDRARGRRQARAHIEGVELRLAPTIEFSGRLLDCDDTPVPNHDVRTARGGSERASKVPELVHVGAEYVDAHTDAQGRFRVRALAEHVYHFDVDHPQRPSLRVAHRPADGELTLRFERGAELAGSVFLADGSPAVGAKVSWFAVAARETACDATGRFRLVGLEFAAGRTLHVAHDAAAIFVKLIEAAPQGDLRVQLEPPQTIRGRVIDAQGRPVVGAELHVVGDRILELGFVTDQPTTWEYAAGRNRTTSAADGSFVFTRLYPGEFAVRALDPTALDAYAEVSVRSGTEDVVLRLPDLLRERVTLRGRVSAASGELPARLRVSLWRVVSNDGGSISERASMHDLLLQDGRFELRGVQPGELRLDIQHAGFARWTQPRRDYAAGIHELSIELLRQRNLRVEVRDRSGAPVAGFVGAATAQGERLWTEHGSMRSTVVPLDKHGRAQVNGLPECAIVLQVQVPGRDTPIEQPVDLPSLRDDVVRIEIDAPPQIASLVVILLVAAPDADVGPLLAIRDLDALIRALRGKSLVRSLDVDCQVRLVATAGNVVSRSQVETRVENSPEPAYRVASTWANGGSAQQQFIPMAWPSIDLRAYAGALQLEVDAKGYEPVRQPVRESDFAPEPREGEARPQSRRVVPVLLRQAK